MVGLHNSIMPDTGDAQPMIMSNSILKQYMVVVS